jgi:hypothetical protein
MATRSAIAEMGKVEQDRMRLVTGRLAKRLAIEDVKPAERVRQPDLQQVFQMRAYNDFLEGLDAAIKDEGYTAAAGESKADQAKAASFTEGMVEADPDDPAFKRNDTSLAGNIDVKMETANAPSGTKSTAAKSTRTATRAKATKAKA